MTNPMKKTFFLRTFYAVVASILFTSTAALAQPGSGGPGPGTPTVDPTDVPIDGGASLLLAAGGAYSLKRLRAARARKQAQ